MLGTDARAFADERAFPDPLAGGNEVGALVLGAVARVEVVALSEGNGGRTEELRLNAIYRAGGVAQHAVDAHAVLLVLSELFRRLQIFALGQRFRFLRNEPGLDPGELVHEIVEVDHQVADDREIGQRLDADSIGVVILEESGTGQFRLAVDHHAAAAAHTHAARPAIG